MTTQEQIEAFVAEYRPLCEKHGLVVSYDDGYMAREVTPIDAFELDDDDWRQFRASAR